VILLPGGIQSISIFERNGASSEFVTTSGVRDFTYDVAENYFETASGKRRVVSRVHTASMVIVDLGVIDQLKEWEANETLIEFVALGLTRHVQGYDPSYLNITPLISAFGSNTAYRVDIVNEQFTPSWYTNANLLWYNGWETLTTVANGYQTQASGAGSLVASFSSDTQSLTCDGINGSQLSVKTPSSVATALALPFPGTTLSLSIDLTAIASPPLDFENKIGYAFLDKTGSTISGGTFATASGTGRLTNTQTLPAGTMFLVCYIMQLTFLTTATGKTISGKFPSLFVGSSAPEAKY